MLQKLVNHRLIPRARQVRRAVSLLRRGDFLSLARGLREHFQPGSAAAKNYQAWIRRHDTLDDRQRQRLAEQIQTMPRPPRISVVMPVFNPPVEWLRQAIDSVRQQLYPHWELCIADDASTLPPVRRLLAEAAAQDPRIQVVFREANGHISAASNSALERVSGDYVALLDHDDLLAEDALCHVALAILRHPQAGIIYSDEDKVDEANRRCSPYFKSDWNPDLFLSHNMISHLGVYRTSLARAVGGFRLGFEGSQDYDLALRCIEQLRPDQIVHIPRVLYHWRMIPGSAALSNDEKPYALVAGARAINDHLARIGIKAAATLGGGHYRVRYALPDPPPMASLVIPLRNGPARLRQCLESIWRRTTYPNYEIIVVDDGSASPPCLEYLREIAARPGVRVLRAAGPGSVPRCANLGVDQAGGAVVVLLDQAVEVIAPEWLSELVSQALRPGIGAVGACLWYPDDTLWHGGMVLGVGGVAGHAHRGLPRGHGGYSGWAQLIRSCSAVSAACLAIRTSTYRAVGGLNEQELAQAFHDVDFCLRVRAAGHRNLWTPHAELYHHEAASSRGAEDREKAQRHCQREADHLRQCWGRLLEQDPAYNPNLTLVRSDFSLAWPPRHPAAIPQESSPGIAGIKRV
jgi:glycosyltransferase involved in cell wall biosynthesis